MIYIQTWTFIIHTCTHRIPVKFYHLVTVSLLTSSLNANCIWQEMNAESVLLTFTGFGRKGGRSCFFSSSSHSTGLKNGWLLMSSGSTSLLEGSLLRNWKQKQRINALALHSLQLCSSQMLQVCKQTVHNWCSFNNMALSWVLLQHSKHIACTHYHRVWLS